VLAMESILLDSHVVWYMEAKHSQLMNDVTHCTINLSVNATLNDL
jgi:hypothetical protein